jgi:hypothetical protein
MKKESEAKPSMSNLTYFSDDDPAAGYGRSPTENIVGPSSSNQGEFRSPTVNAAANF